MAYGNKSFIRWAGGKTWLTDKIKKSVQGLDISNYIEPFMGGASVFFALDLKCNSFLCDSNKELVCMFNEVKNEPEQVAELLGKLKNTSEDYYRIRNETPDDPAQQAARFLYLNYTSFNGLYRVNHEGKYNVPYGHRKVAFDYDKMYLCSKKLQNAFIESGDFEQTIKYVTRHSLVFIDPPYTVSRKRSDNGFLQYNQKLFSLDDQKRLSSYIDNIKKLEGYYILTNAHDESLREIFQKKGDFVIEETRNSLMSGKKEARGKAQEYIFTNLPAGKE